MSKKILLKLDMESPARELVELLADPALAVWVETTYLSLESARVVSKGSLRGDRVRCRYGLESQRAAYLAQAQLEAERIRFLDDQNDGGPKDERHI